MAADRVEAGRLLGEAKTLLTQAGGFLAEGRNDGATHAAHLAGVLAAQALVVERTGQVGDDVQAEFERLVAGDDDFDPFLGMVLAQGRVLELDSGISAERAASAVERAHWFVAHLNGLFRPVA
jgi:hypothetical protein